LGPIVATTEPYDPEYWFINGRCAPDTMGMPGTALLPHQPYNSVPQMYPGERLLMRVVGAGRQLHPFHHHGNHARILARDAYLMASGAALIGPTVFTITSVPGGTVDAIFEWTGKGLGWDIYGHAPGDAMRPNEWPPDHGKPLPVELPEGQNLTVGGFWSGSPFMGAAGSIPPGEGGLNPNAGFTYMWHSHAEREMVNNDIFPGGLMTMLVIHPPGAPFIE
jgi:FtsP/CotA-like multicopper oxidase with cupredoxin domain